MAIKKKFFDVKLEVLDQDIPIFSSSSDFIIGQTIKYDLTKILRGKNCEAKFKVKKKDNVLVGEIYSFMIQPSFIKKMIERNISIVEDSFVVKGEDFSLRIKPFLITRRRVHRKIRSALRQDAREFITKQFSGKKREEIFQSILSYVFQKTLSKRLKTIYPLAVCEIRMIKIEK
jgi:ribosomal protein S3AE